MSAVLYILLGWLLTVAACYSLGAMLLWRLGAAWSPVAPQFVAGAGLMSNP